MSTFEDADPSHNLQRCEALRLAAICSAVWCFVVAGCDTKTDTKLDGGSSTSSQPSTSSTNDPDPDSTGSSGSSTGPSGDEQRFELAAALACEAAAAPVAQRVPEGEGANLKPWFEMGNQFPYRFELDSTHPFAQANAEGYHCSGIFVDGEEFDDTNIEDWWWHDREWTNTDGLVEVFMATRGVESVVYTGLNTELDGEWPSLPVQEPVHFDISSVCPDYPDLWIPAGEPPDAQAICWRHKDESPIAEAVFVRVE